MACSSFLNDENLVRFRTKPCERLVARGHCNFGDRCQYAHTALIRRNPENIIYSPQLCSFGPRRCRHGDFCPLAHTKEEQLFHPEFYKTRYCELGANCEEYYCPYAHSTKDLKRKELYRPGAVATGLPVGPVRASAPGTAPRSAPTAGAPEGPLAPQGWCYVGDQKDLLVSITGEVVPSYHGDHGLMGETLVRPAQLRSSEDGPGSPCVARLLATSRNDSPWVNTVIKEIRRWMAHVEGRTVAYAPAAVWLVRRTVAMAVLALPPGLHCLESLLKGDGRGLVATALNHDWGKTSLMAKWFFQITTELNHLHRLCISHLCLGPCTVFLDSSNELHIGDFLGKVAWLRYMSSGQINKDDSWAMWYPMEIQGPGITLDVTKRGGRKRPHEETVASLDEYAVDAWQLGLVAFYMLTGEHPYGAVDQPREVCENIQKHRMANWDMLKDFPLWADLIGRLMSHRQEDRLQVWDVLKHPLFWNFEEASTFAKPLLAHSSGRPGERCAWLCHLPCFADLAPKREAPPAPPAPMLARICTEALQGKKPKELVHMLKPLLASTPSPIPVPRHLPSPQVPIFMPEAPLVTSDASAAGALAAYAAVVSQAPPGLWPPAPWSDLHPGARNGAFGQEALDPPGFPGPSMAFPIWAPPWQAAQSHFGAHAGQVVEGDIGAARGPAEALDFVQPGVAVVPSAPQPTTPPRKTKNRERMTPEKTTAESREERDQRVKAALGSLLYLLDKCDEAPKLTPSRCNGTGLGQSSEAIPI